MRPVRCQAHRANIWLAVLFSLLCCAAGDTSNDWAGKQGAVVELTQATTGLEESSMTPAEVELIVALREGNDALAQELFDDATGKSPPAATAPSPDGGGASVVPATGPTAAMDASDDVIHIASVALGDFGPELVQAFAKIARNINALTESTVAFHALVDREAAMATAFPAPITFHDIRALPAATKAHFEAMQQKFDKPKVYAWKLLLYEVFPSSVRRLLVLDNDIFVLADVFHLHAHFDRFLPSQLAALALEQQPTHVSNKVRLEHQGAVVNVSNTPGCSC
jgi:hypothetical protein